MAAIEASGLTVAVAQDFPSLDSSPGAGSGVISAAEWDALLHKSGSDVVFLTWQWQRLWWKQFGTKSNAELHLLVLRDEVGAPVAVAPLYIAAEPLAPLKEYRPGELRPTGEGGPLRIVRFVGGTEIADYLDVIATPDLLHAVWAAVLDYLVAHRDKWDVIDFHSLPEWSQSRGELAALVAERGLSVQLVAEDACPVLPLPDDWNTYLMSLRKKDRHELRRKVRKLEGRDDVRWYLVPCDDHTALREGMDTFLDLHRKSGPDKAEFMDEPMSAYFREVALSLAGEGWLDLAILEMDGQPAAAYLSFIYGNRLYLYNSGYDPRFASYSAGIALLAYRIHKAINQGIKIFDFLRGDEAYKYDFGAKNTYVYRGLITEDFSGGKGRTS